MSELATPRETAESYGQDFWRTENQTHLAPHFRLRKCARIVNAIARGRECSLLDIGCGPETLMSALNANIHYYGIDFALNKPAAHLCEVDIFKAPIAYDDMKFDIVAARRPVMACSMHLNAHIPLFSRKLAVTTSSSAAALVVSRFGPRIRRGPYQGGLARGRRPVDGGLANALFEWQLQAGSQQTMPSNIAQQA